MIRYLPARRRATRSAASAQTFQRADMPAKCLARKSGTQVLSCAPTIHCASVSMLSALGWWKGRRSNHRPRHPDEHSGIPILPTLGDLGPYSRCRPLSDDRARIGCLALTRCWFAANCSVFPAHAH
jgi:hypothetical protein